MPFPSKRNKAVEDEILSRMSKGETLASICRSDPKKFPIPTTWNEWCRNDEDLSIRHGRARDEGYDAIASDCLRIADTPVIGEEITIEGEDEKIKKADMLGHRRLQIETRLKLLAKWDPRRYGDKTIIGGDEDNPLTVKSDEKSNEEIARNIAFLLAKAQKGAADDPQP